MLLHLYGSKVQVQYFLSNIFKLIFFDVTRLTEQNLCMTTAWRVMPES